MVKLSYVLIKENQISEAIYTASHHKSGEIVIVCPGQKNKQFYSMLNVNANYKNILPLTVQQYKTKKIQNSSNVFIQSAPTTFQDLQEILKRGESQKHSTILLLLHQNKKYLNIIGKKIPNIQLQQLNFSHNKFVGINDKIRDLVDKSYDMNRAAFYAYGQYINYLRANLLKKIFRTQIINLDDLARSYGFTSAQRVKQGTFLKSNVQTTQKALKKAQKRKRRKLAKQQIRQKQQQQNNQNQIQQQEQVQVKVKVSKNKKIAKVKKSKVSKQ